MRFGVATGLALEAGRLAAVAPDLPIASGAGPAARAAVGGLLEAGAEALLGFGLAGGLGPEVGTGDLIVATAVVEAGGRAHACDQAWQTHLQAVLTGPHRVRSGPLLGADRVLLEPAEKRALAAATGALAVDTESHHLAALAAEAGRPFAVLRVVVDRAGDRLPPFAAASYDGDGRVRIGAIVGALMRNPGELRALVRLAGQSRRALAALGGVGRLGAALGPPL